jgi:acyl dehydratase
LNGVVFNPDKLLRTPAIETRQVLKRDDVILYALGVGATALPFTYEVGLKVLPTMPVVMAYPGFVWRELDVGINWRQVLHGETSVIIHNPLPVAGELVGHTTFGPVFDKGKEKGAVAYQTREIKLADGTRLATVRNGAMLRGDGGFGGSSQGQPQPHAVPDRTADDTIVLPTTENQALIYRLSGDRNPLHIDPVVAKAAGFPGPILHGLASFGVAGRGVLAALCDNDPACLRRLDVRFSSPVYPGETIRIEIWREEQGRASFRATAQERGLNVLNNGYAEFV